MYSPLSGHVLRGKNWAFFVHMTNSPFFERRGYSQAVLTPNAAEFRRLCKAMGGEADFGASKLGQLARCGCDPKDIGQLGSKAVFSIGVWQRSCFGALLELKRSEPTWKYIKSDKFSCSILKIPPGLHVARTLRTTQWTDGNPKGGMMICGVFVFRSPTSLGWKTQIFTQLGVKLHERLLHFRSVRGSKYWGTTVSWNKELVVFFQPHLKEAWGCWLYTDPDSKIQGCAK